MAASLEGNGGPAGLSGSRMADGGGGAVDPPTSSGSGGGLDEEYILQWNDHKYNFFSLAADDVFRSEEMTDVTVVCGDRLFDAHKLILSVCSPLFRSMISRCSSRFQNQHPVVFLKVRFETLPLESMSAHLRHTCL